MSRRSLRLSLASFWYLVALCTCACGPGEDGLPIGRDSAREYLPITDAVLKAARNQAHENLETIEAPADSSPSLAVDSLFAAYDFLGTEEEAGEIRVGAFSATVPTDSMIRDRAVWVVYLGGVEGFVSGPPDSQRLDEGRVYQIIALVDMKSSKVLRMLQY